MIGSKFINLISILFDWSLITCEHNKHNAELQCTVSATKDKWALRAPFSKDFPPFFLCSKDLSIGLIYISSDTNVTAWFYKLGYQDCFFKEKESFNVKGINYYAI